MTKWQTPPFDPKHHREWQDGDLRFYESAGDLGFNMGMAVEFEHKGSVLHYGVKSRPPYDSLAAETQLRAYVERLRANG